MRKTEVHHSYLNAWRGVLLEVLDWPDEQLEEYITPIRAAHAQAGDQSALYHDVAARYVKRFAIPVALRASLINQPGGTATLYELETRIEHMISSFLDINGNCDWARVKEELESILVPYGHAVPDRADAIQFWKLRSDGAVH